jgi:hypothetical protein
MAPVRADMNLLREVLARTRAVRTPAAPGIGSYARALAAAFGRWLSRTLRVRSELTDQVALAVNVAAVALLATALSILAVWLWRRLTARRSSTGAPTERAAWRSAPEPASETRDRSLWRRRIDELLSAGDLAGALEALWWWFAASLDFDGAVDPSWTTRELLRRARRPELAPAAAALDVLMYGPRVPSSADVTSCVGRLEEILA